MLCPPVSAALQRAKPLQSSLLDQLFQLYSYLPLPLYLSSSVFLSFPLLRFPLCLLSLLSFLFTCPYFLSVFIPPCIPVVLRFLNFFFPDCPHFPVLLLFLSPCIPSPPSLSPSLIPSSTLSLSLPLSLSFSLSVTFLFLIPLPFFLPLFMSSSHLCLFILSCSLSLFSSLLLCFLPSSFSVFLPPCTPVTLPLLTSSSLFSSCYLLSLPQSFLSSSFALLAISSVFICFPLFLFFVFPSPLPSWFSSFLFIFSFFSFLSPSLHCCSLSLHVLRLSIFLSPCFPFIFSLFLPLCYCCYLPPSLVVFLSSSLRLFTSFFPPSFALLLSPPPILHFPHSLPLPPFLHLYLSCLSSFLYSCHSPSLNVIS
ncbi:uncharacterized protein LOC120435383 [Oreochromis aureus]|uniref:uncharacterized protein LOC120435383 n=1 Tax=Oreochromis aureus TaxID=47969 RepID=UPI001954DC56|nr:uncharacterized protein LOC120435383 [Oreochromis aureus]XP_039460829.1 uncharacterized protein LOC120435383 [Oreochromis aureus]XP_039460830.1 uncharacterized protein LOC120435383 [Oreochromis aureus]XP_039460831.1 uncharacterized protein LOC120435383 [Oreochromis aureus]XP_039460832.1 uncharacterized protein LOC120435383 [Oreochromis aureus]XP_039460833.1 uncharacterized protein LOC120435383 [Oreochromis aureus]